MSPFLRRCVLAAAAVTCGLLASCATPAGPPLVARVPAPPPPVTTAILLTSERDHLAREELERRRPDVVDYLTQHGYITATDQFVNDAARADRIVRVTITSAGDYRVTVFTPGLAQQPLFPRYRRGDLNYRYYPRYDPFYDDPFYYSYPYGYGLDFGYPGYPGRLYGPYYPRPLRPLVPRYRPHRPLPPPEPARPHRPPETQPGNPDDHGPVPVPPPPPPVRPDTTPRAVDEQYPPPPPQPPR